MRNSGLVLTTFDLGIERTTHAIRREVEEATLAQKDLSRKHQLISLDSEEEITMAVVPLPTMGDYYKKTDEGHVYRGFVMAKPTNFDIKHFVLSGLRGNLFDENTIRDMWEHLSRLYKITSMCRPTDITEDQVKLRLFGFSLIGRSKDWLTFLPNGTIQTWKDMNDKFLDRFFTTT